VARNRSSSPSRTFSAGGAFGARWRKSSFSGGNGEGCIEVAFLDCDRVAVRGTKDRTVPPHLHAAAAWSAFVAGVLDGEFDRL